MLTAWLSAVALSILTAQEIRRADGGIWGQPNSDPSTITLAYVDTLMWPIVERINQSGWVWTTESCQGHEDGSMLTLGLVTNDIGRVFTAIADAQANLYANEPPDHSLEAQDPHGFFVQVKFWRSPVQSKYGRYQVRLTTPQLVEGLRVFTTVAQKVTP